MEKRLNESDRRLPQGRRNEGNRRDSVEEHVDIEKRDASERRLPSGRRLQARRDA